MSAWNNIPPSLCVAGNFPAFSTLHCMFSDNSILEKKRRQKIIFNVHIFHIMHYCQHDTSLVTLYLKCIVGFGLGFWPISLQQELFRVVHTEGPLPYATFCSGENSHKPKALGKLFS